MKNDLPRRELRAFAILLVLLFTGTEALLAHNTLYTEGEVMQALYWLLVCVNLPIIAVAFWKPRIGIWCAFLLGALLLPWQASENRKWAIIHEEVFAIINHVKTAKESEGIYPSNLDGYEYRQTWIRNHLSYGTSEGSYSLHYFMDDSSISYWYTPENGFGYYPD